MPGSSCAIFGCINKFMKGGSISLHLFPKDPNLRSYWTQACRRQDWIPTKSSVVCSDHFHKNDYEVMKPGQKKPKLKPGAIPSRKRIYHKGAPIKSAQPFTCSQCKAEYTSESDLKHHITLMHINPTHLEIDLPIIPAKLYTCPQCVATYCSENDLQQHNTFAHGSVPSNDVQNQSDKQESQATFLPDIARHESDTMTKASINMDQAVLEPMLNKHNLVAFLVNMGWVLIRRRDYIDAFIHNQPYNSVQILFETATKVSIYI